MAQAAPDTQEPPLATEETQVADDAALDSQEILAAEDVQQQDVLSDVRTRIPAFCREAIEKALHGCSPGAPVPDNLFVPNEHSLPGSPLYEKFAAEHARESLEVTLCFHGTAEANIAPIRRDGLDSSRRGTGFGQKLGRGEYFACSLPVALHYARRCRAPGSDVTPGTNNSVLVCAVLTRPDEFVEKRGLAAEAWGRIIVCTDPRRTLPLGVLNVSHRPSELLHSWYEQPGVSTRPAGGSSSWQAAATSAMGRAQARRDAAEADRRQEQETISKLIRKLEHDDVHDAAEIWAGLAEVRLGGRPHWGPQVALTLEAKQYEPDVIYAMFPGALEALEEERATWGKKGGDEGGAGGAGAGGGGGGGKGIGGFFAAAAAARKRGAEEPLSRADGKRRVQEGLRPEPASDRSPATLSVRQLNERLQARRAPAPPGRLRWGAVRVGGAVNKECVSRCGHMLTVGSMPSNDLVVSASGVGKVRAAHASPPLRCRAASPLRQRPPTWQVHCQLSLVAVEKGGAHDGRPHVDLLVPTFGLPVSVAQPQLPSNPELLLLQPGDSCPVRDGATIELLAKAGDGALGAGQRSLGQERQVTVATLRLELLPAAQPVDPPPPPALSGTAPAGAAAALAAVLPGAIAPIMSAGNAANYPQGGSPVSAPPADATLRLAVSNAAPFLPGEAPPPPLACFFGRAADAGLNDRIFGRSTPGLAQLLGCREQYLSRHFLRFECLEPDALLVRCLKRQEGLRVVIEDAQQRLQLVAGTPLRLSAGETVIMDMRPPMSLPSAAGRHRLGERLRLTLERLPTPAPMHLMDAAASDAAAAAAHSRATAPFVDPLPAWPVPLQPSAHAALAAHPAPPAAVPVAAPVVVIDQLVFNAHAALQELAWPRLRDTLGCSAPPELAAGQLDPITCEPLGADGEEVVRLPCGSGPQPCVFNRSTVERAFAAASRCPGCSKAYQLAGPQPGGTMTIARSPLDCEGHAGRGSLCVTFEFPPALQTARHPRPGISYAGRRVVCHYPDDEDTGVAALRVLRRAFARGLLFRIGESATRGMGDQVVFGLHQKTRRDGGAAVHGWPDAGYVARLRSEAAALGLGTDDAEGVAEA